MNEQKHKMLRDREIALGRLKDGTDIDDRSQLDVLDEATFHMAEHFSPPPLPEFKRDYVFLMGKTYLGTEKKDPTKDVAANCLYFGGDLHEMSHDLAHLMDMDPIIRQHILHAVSVWTQLNFKKGGR